MSKRILIVNPFGIGDVLFTTPLIRTLKQELPNAEIAFWSCKNQEKILSTNPNLFKIFALSRGDLKGKPQLERMRLLFGLIRQLKKERFDVAFDFALDHRYTMILRLSGINKIIGLGYKGRGRFLSHRIDIQGFSDKHVADYYLDTLKFLNIYPKFHAGIEVFSSLEDDSWANDFIKRQNIPPEPFFIAVCPAGGESWGSDSAYKRWPEEKFADLCDRLIEKSKATIILFGSEQEKDLVGRLAGSMRNRAINTAGKLSFGQFVALLKKCSLAICNDSGPLHLAEGLGLKTVCISGPVDERVYGPYPINERNLVVKRELSCRPCYKNFRFKGCDHNQECLRGISVDEVFKVAEKLIKC